MRKTTNLEEIKKCHPVQISKQSSLQVFHSQDHLAPEPLSRLAVAATQGLEIQLHDYSRQRSRGLRQGISMGSESPTTPKRFNSQLTQTNFSIQKSQ